MEEDEKIWQSASDRDAILRAMWDIEARVRNDPNDVGESRPNDQRITFATPLGVLFEIDHAIFKVEITSAWAIRQV